MAYTTESQINEFLNEYKRSKVVAETSVRAILKRAIEWENKFDKPFDRFTKEEALEMFKSAHAISSVSLQNSNLTLRNAARWILDNNGMDIKNIYDEIGKYDLDGCIDVKKKKNLILTRDDLTGIQNELLNYTDKGILEMLFLGAGGNWLKELTFFDSSQLSKKDGVIYFRTGKIIPITNEQYEIIHNACLETELISFGETMRVSQVQSEGIYKIRCNARSTNSNPNDEQDMERRFRFIQRRLYLMSQNYDVKLTSGGIQNSGLLHYLKQGVKESGLNFRNYVKTEKAKVLARRYDIFSEYSSQILFDKFQKYFND